jgi:hypothetical protein
VHVLERLGALSALRPRSKNEKRAAGST